MNNMTNKMCDILVQLLQMAQAGKIEGLVFTAITGDSGVVGAIGMLDPELIDEMLDKMREEAGVVEAGVTHEYVGGMLQ